MDNKEYCDIVLDVFIKCIRTNDSYIKLKCNELEKNLRTTWLQSYIDCTKVKK